MIWLRAFEISVGHDGSRNVVQTKFSNLPDTSLYRASEAQ
jgi:hypothetical protein